jgi:hypothetical protein
MPNSSRLPFQQSLSRAIDLEDDHISQFRTWALRLRPFHLSLARILDLQADEMDDHKRMLLDCSRMRTNHLRNRPIATTHQSPAAAEHFFVLNVTGATTILEKARALKEEARNLYRYCVLTEAENTRLIREYQALQKFKDSHIQILLETQAGFASKHHQISAMTRTGACLRRFRIPDRQLPAHSMSCRSSLTGLRLKIQPTKPNQIQRNG